MLYSVYCLFYDRIIICTFLFIGFLSVVFPRFLKRIHRKTSLYHQEADPSFEFRPDVRPLSRNPLFFPRLPWGTHSFFRIFLLRLCSPELAITFQKEDVYHVFYIHQKYKWSKINGIWEYFADFFGFWEFISYIFYHYNWTCYFLHKCLVMT